MKGKSRVTQEFKYAVAEDGTFEGLLATYNNVDLGGDSIEPGAFTKSLQENGNVIPLLWQHDSRQPIGSLTVSDTAAGLQVKGEILTDTPVGDYAYKTIKRTPVKGLSIGYDTVKHAWDGPVRRLKELRLWEGSIVTFPMDTNALIMSVKHAKETKDDFNAELAEQQLYDAGPQMMGALRDAVYSVFWDGALSDNDKVAMVQASIQQFSDSYLKWLPEFLAFMRQEYGDIETMGRQVRERKEGRMISDSNKKTIQAAHDHIAAAADLIRPLCSDEAGATSATTSEGKAGRESEPEILHSAAKTLDLLRSLIPKA
jgi:HK97 family phage prohead protease